MRWKLQIMKSQSLAFAAPRGLFGNIGLMAVHSWSVSS